MIFIIGLAIGILSGFFLCCMLVIAREEEKENKKNIRQIIKNGVSNI